MSYAFLPKTAPPRLRARPGETASGRQRRSRPSAVPLPRGIGLSLGLLLSLALWGMVIYGVYFAVTAMAA